MKKCPYCAEEIQDEAIVCKHCNRDLETTQPKKPEGTLQEYANQFVKNGWTIGSITDQQFVATRRKGMHALVALVGIIGLFFYLIPGLLILLIGYVSRGTETQIVTAAEAQQWKEGKQKKAQALQTQQEAKQAAREKKIEELQGSPLQFWYKLPEDQQMMLGALGGVIALILVIYLLSLAS